MKIGIDCRLFGPKHTGIGRYVENLVENLLELDKNNHYVLFVNSKETSNSTMKQSNNVTIVKTNIPHYSLREQLFLPRIIKKENLDLMHFPHFNAPVLYGGRYVVTIHDLIKHTSRGTETTTRSPWLYSLKYLGYKYVFEKAVKRAERIITPSQFVKGEVVKEYGVDPKKIVVTYEGVDGKLSIFNDQLSNNEILLRYGIKKPYLLYVGSVYPHKNIERLIETVKKREIQLVIVCARNVFSERLRSKIVQLQASDDVNMVGYISDPDLAVLYREAQAFVFPTLSEGFGLPGLEAMALSCPVICSNIPVLQEIYRDSAIYFDPLNLEDIAEKIKIVLSDEKLQNNIKEKGLALVKNYSWTKMARETIAIYQSM